MEKRWMDKYTTKRQVQRGINATVTLHKDKYGAVLYAINSFGEEQYYYDSEQEYLKAITRSSYGRN